MSDGNTDSWSNSRKSIIRNECHKELLETSEEYRILVERESEISLLMRDLNEELTKTTLRIGVMLREKINK